ncbi:MAG TPA: hypothetical protein VN948_18080 [Terriglobales bacterium]|nr:hypothetical protein [Terriglobales bacterium]
MLVSRSPLIFVLTLLFIPTLVNAAKPASKPQEVFAPYWTAEAGWETELQLKNNLAAGPLTVTPVLRLASGQEIALDPVTIPSNASVSVWVNEALLKHSAGLLNQPGSYGSVAFRFTSFNARNLYASAVLSLHGGPIGFQINAYPAAGSEAWPRAALAGSREGIWWQPRPVELGQAENDVLILSNSSDRTLAGTLWLSDAAGKRWSQRLSLAAHQTRRLNVRELVGAAGLSGQYGGIQFEVPANAGALDSVHLMYDETAKSSASLKMFSHDPGATLQERTWAGNKQWTMWAPMLALRTPDPAAGLPARTKLQPTIFVRNTTAKKLSASITISWRGDSGRGQAKLPELYLAPFATQQLQIGTMQKQLGIPDDAHWALVTLTSPASPDDLIAVVSSHDRTGRYNLETPFSDNLGGHFAGGEWQVDATHNALAAVTNGGIRATDALLTLHYDNGKKKYEMQQTIQPGDQMWVNFADLIRNRVPDRKGNVLPVDVIAGTYDLQDLNPSPGSLMQGNLALDHTWGFQASPPGPTCCATNVVFNPTFVDLPVNIFDSLEADGTNVCSGDQTNVSGEITDWWSTDPPIAQVTTQKVQGVAPGLTEGHGKGLFLEGQGSNCALRWVYIQLPVTVQVPTSATIIDNVVATAKSVSSKEIGACHIEQFGAYHALAEISQKADVAIGVDAVQPEEEPTIVLDFPGGTVSDLLNMFVSQAPDYQWQEGRDGTLHVSRRDAHVSLLDVAMSYRGAHDKTRQEISQDISNIPEVSAWLNSNHCPRDQFSHGGEFRSHNDPISIGSGLLTVEQLLDEVALKSGANYWAVLRTPASRPCRVTLIL